MKNLKKKLMVLLSAFMIVTFLLALSTSVLKSAGAERVAVCHFGDVAIAIGAAAVDVHLGHGDDLGECTN